MKSKTLRLGIAIVLSLFFVSSYAAVWRVNSAPGSSADFTSIQDAHDNASHGDTLYIEGSAAGVGNFDNCTKKLIIIGTGYFLGENPETQASPLASAIGRIYFKSGSEGSKLMGCYVNRIGIYTSNIFITRCYLYGGSGTTIYSSADNISNIVITQNYINASNYPQWVAISFTHAATNVLISNNYVTGIISSYANFSGILTNNVVYGSIQVHNSVVKNNIISGYGSFTDNNCVYTHNMSHNASFGNQNGNLSNVNMGTVFVGPTGNSTDGQWMLKTGSPAIGAGENGADMGMYGGAFPYILSGMPNIPAVYYFNAPAIPSNTIDVAIKAKSHN